MNNQDKQDYIDVEIFGENYKIIGKNQEREQILNIVQLIDEKMKNLANSFPQYSKKKIAILTALNLGDEIFKFLEKENQYEEKIQSLTHFIQNILK